MIYQLRVDNSLYGFGSDNARVDIVAGEYEVEAELRDSLSGDEYVLVFKAADRRNGGDIVVPLALHPALWDFPSIPPNAPVVILRLVNRTP